MGRGGQLSGGEFALVLLFLSRAECGNLGMSPPQDAVHPKFKGPKRFTPVHERLPTFRIANSITLFLLDSFF